MRARPRNNFGAVLDEAVQFAGKRGDFGREGALQPLRLAVTNARQGFADTPERLKSDPHLDENRDDEAKPEHEKGPEQDLIETGDAPVDLREIAGDEERIGARFALVLVECDRKLDPAADGPQVLTIGAFRVAQKKAAQFVLVGGGEQLVEQRPR